MSELMTIEGNVPSYLANVEKSDLAKSLGVTDGGSGYKWVSIKGGVFRMMVGSKEMAKNEDRSMNMVVVASAPAIARTYYASAYKEGENAAPACWSDDGNKPSEHCTTPEAKSCNDCPQNVAGSGNGNSRACGFSSRLAVVLESDIKGDVFGIKLPATSIFGKAEDKYAPFQEYIKRLVAQKIDPATVVTEFRFDTSGQYPKLKFAPVRYLTEDEYEAAQKQGETKESEMATGAREFKSMDEEVPFEKKAEPQIEEAEPTKVAKKKAEPKQDTDLDSVLDEWAED